MLDRVRHFLARVIAPEIVVDPNAEPAPEEGADHSMPEFDATATSPLGLRAVEEQRRGRLEDTAEFLRTLDPVSRDRVIAYAQPKLTGRQKILTRHASEMDAWYRDHPND